MICVRSDPSFVIELGGIDLGRAGVDVEVDIEVDVERWVYEPDAKSITSLLMVLSY